MDNLWIIYGLWFIYGQYMDNLWIWLVVKSTPLKIYELVSWDDDIPN